MKVADFLKQKKSGPIHSVNANESAAEATSRLVQKNIGVLLVLDGGKLAGIISEKDIVLEGLGKSLDLAKTPVSKLMTQRVVTCNDGDRLAEALATLCVHSFRHLPVVDSKGLPVGMISDRDVIEVLVK